MSFEQVAAWDQFVAEHPHGTIFHSRAMLCTLQNTARHCPLAVAALDESDTVLALLAAVKVSTLGVWARQFASRSILFGEPIFADSDAGYQAAKLLIGHHDSIMRRQALFCEVRNVFAPPAGDPLIANGYEHLGYLNYELCLTASEEVLWQKLNSKCRNNIRSSMRRGLVVREGDLKTDRAKMYELFAYSYANSKVPIVDQSLFESAIKHLPKQQVRVLIADLEGETVAAACFLSHKKRVTYWYSGALRITGIAAMSCVVWEAIRAYAAEGYEVFDFAGAGWEGEEYGPGRFKAKFGGELTNFGRYRKVYAPRKLRLATSTYQTLRGWLSRSRNAKSAEARAGS